MLIRVERVVEHDSAICLIFCTSSKVTLSMWYNSQGVDQISLKPIDW